MKKKKEKIILNYPHRTDEPTVAFPDMEGADPSGQKRITRTYTPAKSAQGYTM
jgi:hypothetical protein